MLVPGATVADADYEANWSKIAAMGWPGLVIDEAYDGLGLSCIDLAMILGEMGRTLAPSPFLGTLFGAWAVQKGGSEAQKKRSAASRRRRLDQARACGRRVERRGRCALRARLRRTSAASPGA